MKFEINGNTYTAFDSLRFNPEVDLSNDSLPINEFEARLFTNANISYGQWAVLKDDNNNVWARYWLRYAERIGRDDDRQTYIVKIIGQSPLAFFERVKMPPKMYNDSAYNVLNDILTYVDTYGQDGDIMSSALAADWGNISIVGFCPEQTARDRLQWLLMVAGGYVTSYFDSSIRIKTIATSGGTLIPLEKTFWKPSIGHRDYVTKINLHAYTFTQGTPQNTDVYVTDGTHYWIVSEQVISVTNDNVPSGVPSNEIDIEGVHLISPDRASTILTNLVTFYFQRVEVDTDIINNAEFKPGDLVITYIDEDQLYQGYINRCDFSFGLQARGRLHLTPAEATEGAKLTLVYMWGEIKLAERSYTLPVGYTYYITTEYLDLNVGGHRYIFRPETELVSGSLTEDTDYTVSCVVALENYIAGLNLQSQIKAEWDQMKEWLLEYYAEQGSRDESVIAKVDYIYEQKYIKADADKAILKIDSVDGIWFDTSDGRVVEIS